MALRLTECDKLCKIFFFFFLCVQQLKSNTVLVTSLFVMQVVMVSSEVTLR